MSVLTLHNQVKTLWDFQRCGEVNLYFVGLRGTRSASWSC